VLRALSPAEWQDREDQMRRANDSALVVLRGCQPDANSRRDLMRTLGVHGIANPDADDGRLIELVESASVRIRQVRNARAAQLTARCEGDSTSAGPRQGRLAEERRNRHRETPPRR
jgi:hypothetical protein